MKPIKGHVYYVKDYGGTWTMICVAETPTGGLFDAYILNHGRVSTSCPYEHTSDQVIGEVYHVQEPPRGLFSFIGETISSIFR